MDDELCQLKPIFDIPSKIRCNVFSIKLKVETTTDEIYAEISLLSDTSVEPIPCQQFIDGVNTKFSIGSRFLMKFEGRYFNDIR
ncbi:hypothetical protein DY000_02024364 [Brassica cretica]|uniref:Uncharacterized protein n=1 Tax=Brassica cretica TaxID=69181 RepID=A0ABQ7E3D9_BRACR|nr:hypothetical protein DY000_02024364 [Brassica cretica]